MKNIKSILQNEKKFNKFAKSLFEHVDTESSGEIDPQELSRAMKRLAKEFEIDDPEKEDIYDLFEYMDVDGSGTLDYEEFKSLVKDILSVIVIESEKIGKKV